MIQSRFNIAFILILLLGVLPSISLAASNIEIQKSGEKVSVTFTTFNLKWFGLGGAMWNTPDQEFRENLILRFLNEELPDTDLFLFTEVVNTELLAQTLKGRYECVSYEGKWSRHQHVVLCFNPSKFRVEKFDEDYIISEVDLGSGGQRPALQAKVCHKNGSCFLQVIGVHLAAGPRSEKRIEQFNHIKDNFLKQDQMLPTVLAGDFNSYSKQQSGLEKDDIDIFEELISSTQRSFKSINREIKTYSSGEWARTYDHIIISTDTIHSKSTQGYQSCQTKTDLREKFIPYINFRKYFSDHCPVTSTLQIPP